MQGRRPIRENRKAKLLKEEDARTIIKQLALALNYCHANHIVHRDIKPENILMLSDDLTDMRVKLIDFGTAIEYTTSSTKLMKYMDPPTISRLR